MKRVTDNGQYSIVLICVSAGLFLSTLDTGIINIALEPLASNFTIPLEQTGLTVTLYLFCLIISLIPAGWLGDNWGKQKSITVGFLLFGITSLFAGLALNFEQLVIARSGQGIAAGLLQANAIGLVGEQSAKHRQRLTTVMMLAISLGPILGPVIGSMLLTISDWRMLFLINIPFCLLGICASLALKAQKTASSMKWDVKGLMTFIIILSLVIVAIYHRYLGIKPLYISMVIGFIIILLFVFYTYESRIESPFFPVSILNSQLARCVLLGSCVFGFSAGVLFASSPILLLRHTDLNYQQIGLICMGAPVGLATSTLLKKYVLRSDSDEIGMRVGMSIVSLSMFILALIGTHISGLTFVVLSWFYGLGGGWFQRANLKLSMSISDNLQSTMGGLLRLFQNVGIIFGAALALYLIDGYHDWWLSGYALNWLITGAFALIFVGLTCFVQEKS